MAEAYPNIDNQVLNLIKYPPIYSPEANYFNDNDYSSNNLRGNLFQFCYRYIYDTKMKSVFSPYSRVPIPQEEELANGDFTPNFKLNNAIAIKVRMGHHTVETVEVAYRHGNNGTLYVFDRIEKYPRKEITGTFHKDSNIFDNIGRDGGITVQELKSGMVLDYKRPVAAGDIYIVSIDAANNRVYLSANSPFSGTTRNIDKGYLYIEEEYIYAIFRNDKVDYAVSEKEAIESFDAVPITARSMEVIESNRIVVGGPKLGYPNTPINAGAIINHTQVSDYFTKYKADSYLAKDIKHGDFTMNSFVMVIPSSLPANSIIQISLSFIDVELNTPLNFVVNYFNNEPLTNKQIADYIREQINRYATSAPSPVNFTCAEVISGSDPQYHPEYYVSYNGLQTYLKNKMVSYLGGIYIATQTARMGDHPSGNTTDNSHWDYLCPVANVGEIIQVFTQKFNDGITSWSNTHRLENGSFAVLKAPQIYPILKYGHRVNLAIAYLDEARRPSAANVSSEISIDIPRMKDIATLDYNNYINQVALHIMNLPPEFAHYYSILMDKNIPWFFQFYFYGFAHTSPDIEKVNTHYHIKVNRSIGILRDNLPKSMIEPYVFVKGDRIRLLSYQNARDVTYSQNRWRNYPAVYDAEIIGYDYPDPTDEDNYYLKDDAGEYVKDGNGNKLRRPATGYIITESFESDSGLESSVYVLYEIYRPVKATDENTAYFETIATYPIGNPELPNRFHKGDSNSFANDQDPDNPITTPARINLEIGNVYRKMRYSGEADIYFPVESLSISDFYESKAISIGRVNTISKDLGQVDLENWITWSGSIIEGTAINRLNKFNAKDKVELQSKHGPITALLEKGFILYAWQWKKITSLYIGRTVLTNPDGTDDVKMITDAVFGTVRPATDDYGCNDPKSISNSSHHIYFWDSFASKWCRLAYNGTTAISEYGKDKDFTDLNAIMKLASNRSSLSVFDNKYEELIVSHRYKTAADYDLSIVGQYVIGDNKLTGIGRSGGVSISQLQVGMIITGMTSAQGNPELDVVIMKIDSGNKIVYLDNKLPFAEGITGTVELSGEIHKKYEMQTWAFHEPANGWKTRYPFNQELMAAYGSELVSFINGDVYLHDSRSVPYNYFNGIQFEQYIQFPFNSEQGLIKILEGIEYVANKRGWGAIVKGDITIKNFDASNTDMESMLPETKFRNVEGVLVSELLRDMNTPGHTNEKYALMNGRYLRGHAGVIKLTTFETTKTVLYSVSIVFNPSM